MIVETPKTAEDAAEAAFDLLALLGYAGIGLLIGMAVAFVVGVILRIVARRKPLVGALTRHAGRPFHVTMMVLGVWLGVLAFTTAAYGSVWRQNFRHIALLVFIASLAWLAIGLLRAVEDIIVSHHQQISSTDYSARVTTQMQVLRRVGSAVIVVCALAGALLTFDGARAIGASLFASAGVISLVAGLAAQSSLTNVFAGMQIAFSDALRVDDLCMIDEQLATIEEITLTYVVARTWDDRRIILPSTRFTTKPFENWTRREPKLLGSVEMDLDWLVPIDALRAQLQEVVSTSDLWDGRACSLQVTEATDGRVRVRAVVSAANSGDLWDLRCHTREQLVDWLQATAPYSLPRTRVETRPFQAPSLEARSEFNERMTRRAKEAKERREEKRRREQSDTLRELAAVEPAKTDDRRRQSAARRARRQAERADRRAQRSSRLRLGGNRWREPLPNTERTQVLTAAEQAELERALDRPAQPERAADTGKDADAMTHEGDTRVPEEGHSSGGAGAERLYSGSAEAEERAQRMSGPGQAAMAEREKAAQRRRENEKPAPADDDE
ncbi:MAG: mechanosensitive ion channel family protein [Bowdeniella nasicola]|nr:mechanosensitive ion channel family protein [Bowdeniella nasicola]